MTVFKVGDMVRVVRASGDSIEKFVGRTGQVAGAYGPEDGMYWPYYVRFSDDWVDRGFAGAHLAPEAAVPPRQDGVLNVQTGQPMYFVSKETEGDFEVGDAVKITTAIVADPDVISHPSHYTSGLPEGVEVIDIIRAQQGSWEHSNAIKYVLRAQFKGNYKQDIDKAIQYLTWARDRWDEPGKLDSSGVHVPYLDAN